MIQDKYLIQVQEKTNEMKSWKKNHKSVNQKRSKLNSKFSIMAVLWVSDEYVVHWAERYQSRFALFLPNLGAIPIGFLFDSLVWNVRESVYNQFWIATLAGNAANISRALHLVLILYTNRPDRWVLRWFAQRICGI